MNRIEINKITTINSQIKKLINKINIILCSRDLIYHSKKKILFKFNTGFNLKIHINRIILTLNQS